MIRYLAKVDHRGPDECWEWTAARFDKGYGAFRLGQKQMKAHRFGYMNLVGPIPDGQYVLHRCDNPPCNNPAHWFLGTHGDNAQDRRKKGRNNTVKGAATYNAKLSEDDIRNIRALYASGVLQKDIAYRYKIDQPYVSQIVLRKRWASVD